jgi:hypothetical protein
MFWPISPGHHQTYVKGKGKAVPIHAMKQMGSQSIVLCFINLRMTLNGNKQCTSSLSHFIPNKQETGQALELV